MTPSADESARILTGCIERREPFFFIRYGDGALECIYKKQGHTCDQERYSAELAAELQGAWESLKWSTQRVFAGDWMAASFEGGKTYERLWNHFIDGAPFEWLHPEALLLMRESEALVGFYRAVRADKRRKVYMGPLENAGAAKLLGAEHFSTSMRLTLEQAKSFGRELANDPPDVLLYGAGMAGNIAAVECWKAHPDRTYISLGSALDPLFRGKSRSQQLPAAKLREMFKELL